MATPCKLGCAVAVLLIVAFIDGPSTKVLEIPSQESANFDKGSRRLEDCPVASWSNLCEHTLPEGACFQVQPAWVAHCELKGPYGPPARLLGNGPTTLQTGGELRITGHIRMTSLRFEAETIVIEEADVETEGQPARRPRVKKGGVLWSKGALSFVNSIVTVRGSQKADEGGGCAAGGDVTLTRSRLEIYNGRALIGGGGVHATGAVRLFQESEILIENAFAVMSAGVLTSAELGIFEHSTLRVWKTGSVLGSGGFMAEGTVTLDAGVIDIKSTKGGLGIGGGFHTKGDLLVTNGSTLSINTSTSGLKAGGFRADGKVVVTGTSTVWLSDTSAGDGGGFFANQSVHVTDNSIFNIENSTAKRHGGGFLANGEVVIDGSSQLRIIECHAISGDGGGFVTVRMLRVTGQATLSIERATARGGGGFVAVAGITIESMSNLSISNGHAFSRDGGGFMTDHGLQVTKGSILSIDNSMAARFGGSFRTSGDIFIAEGSKVSISNSRLQGKGAVPSMGHGAGFSTFSNLQITGHSTLTIQNATGLVNIGGGFTADNVLISEMSTVHISDSTVEGNDTLVVGGGGGFASSKLVQVANGSSLTIQNARGGQAGGFFTPNLHVSNHSVVYLKNVTATKDRGGGFLVVDSLVVTEMSQVRVLECHAAGRCGGFIVGKNMQVTNKSELSIQNTSSAGSGGAFCADDAVVSGMSTVSIVESHAGGDGGGFVAAHTVKVSDRSTLNIRRATSGRNGGGFTASGKVIVVGVSTVSIADTHADLGDGNGGGFTTALGLHVMENSTFSIHNSTAGSSGGGFLADGEVVIDGQSKVKMFDCHAITGDGGGFATRTLDDGAGAIVDRRLQVSGNSALSIHMATAGANGGGFYVEDDLEANSSIIEIFNSSAGEDGGGFNVGRALLGDCEVSVRGAAAKRVAGGFAIRSALSLSSGSISIVNSTADSGAGGLVKGPAILTHSKLAISDAGGDEYSAVLVANCLQLGPKSAFLMEDVNGGHGLDLRNGGCVCTAGTLQVASDAALQASGALSSSFMKVAACPSETVYLSGIHLQSWSTALWSSGGPPPSHVVVENVSVDFEPQLDNVQLLEVEEGFTINSLVVSCPSCTNGVTFISTEHSLHAFSPKADLKCPNQVMVLNGTTPRCTCTDYKITNERFRGMQVVPVEDVFNTCAFCKLHQHYVDGGKCEKCPLYTAWSDGETDVCHMLPREEAERTAILTGAIIFVVSAFILLQLLAAPLYVVDARSDAVNDPPEEVPQRSFAMSVQGPIVDLPKQMSARVHELVSYRITGTGLQWLDFDAEKANNVKVCGVSRRKLRLKDAHAPFDCAACGGVLHPTETGRLFFLIVGILFIFVLLPVAIQVSVASGNTFQHTLVTLAICILPIGVVAALLYYPVACLIRWRYQRTPYADTLSEYQKQIQHKLHPGPDADHPKNQGLLASTLYELWKHFESFILERNMHFIVANIVTPLTSQRQTSFVGLWGGRKVDYFVSHSWGTSFAHFVRSIRCHAVSKEGLGWTDSSYWICSFANNQWKIKEDLGSTIMESAFARALTGGVKGTVMVLDHEVQPLTRVWCLFEFLLSCRENLELVFTTAVGVVGDDACTSFDIALQVGEKIECLKVASCHASSDEDKKNIFEYIVSELGSLDNMDKQIRQLMGQLLKRNLANVGGATASLLQELGQN